MKQLDGALHIPDQKTIAMLYDLLDTEGLYLGASSALNVVAAVELAQQLGPGACLPQLMKMCIDLHITIARQNYCDHSVRRCIPVPEQAVL